MEYHKARYYVGVPCGHCGARNTVADIYRYSIEGWCMSCSREFRLTPDQKASAQRQASDNSIRTNEPRTKVPAMSASAEVQVTSSRSRNDRGSDHGRWPGPRLAGGS